MNIRIMAAVVCVSLAAGCCAPVEDAGKDTVEHIRGAYLGQMPPGETPEIFAKNIIPDIGSEHSAAAFTPDGNEVFWTRTVNKGQVPRFTVIMYMKCEDGVWSTPMLAPFNAGMRNFFNSVSPDGQRVFFSSLRPEEEGGEPVNGEWVCERMADGWSEARLLDPVYVGDKRLVFLQETRSGNRYYRGYLPGVEYEQGLYSAQFINGRYGEPEPVGEAINSPHLDYAFYIDPDEKFILFTSNRPGGFAGGDLYISFRLDDGDWGEAVNLGENINGFSGRGADWATMSPDTKYLFFTSSADPYSDMAQSPYTWEQVRNLATSPQNGWTRIYWVDADFIDSLKPSTE